MSFSSKVRNLSYVNSRLHLTPVEIISLIAVMEEQLDIYFEEGHFNGRRTSENQKRFGATPRKSSHRYRSEQRHRPRHRTPLCARGSKSCLLRYPGDDRAANRQLHRAGWGAK